MNDLLKKLNVLLKSSVNGTVSGETLRETILQPSPSRLAKEAEALRERINEAVRYEDTLTTRLHQVEQEAALWDRQADDAVAGGSEATARHAIENMRRAEQRVTMAQADLRAHQLATQDLIQRVNLLEAVVADALRAQAAANASGEQPAAANPAEALHLPDLANVLREAKEKIGSLGDLVAAQREPDTQQPPPSQPDDITVDDDLEQRRQRLSKR